MSRGDGGAASHPRTLQPADNKFHVGNVADGKHYWLTPPALYAALDAEHGPFDFDPCPFPKPDDFDGLTCEWGACSYVNPPFGSIVHEGKKKGPTAWARKAIAEQQKGKKVVLVYPIDKWVLMLLAAGAKVSNLGDVRWLATEDGSQGKGTGRHIACFVLEPSPVTAAPAGGGLAEVLAALAKATPGEWAQAHRKVHNGYSTEVFDEAGEAIATLAWHAKPPRFEGSQKVISTDRPENAEAIVAAVNYLRSHGEAIAELIEADKEYDVAREGYSDRTATPEQINRLARAELRRRAALAKVASNGDAK